MSSPSRLRRLRIGRGLLAMLVALAFALVGVGSAAPARAATTTLSGQGVGTATVELGTGLYRATLTYSNNTVADGPVIFGALFDNEDEGLLEYLAIDVDAARSTRKVIQLFEPTTVLFDVKEASADAAWTLTFEKLAEPGATVSGVSVKSTGLNSSALYRLKAGTYRATTTYAGNVYGTELPNFQEAGIRISLYGVAGQDHQLVAIENTVAGTHSTTFTIPSTGVYWVNPWLVAANTTWSVDLVALKALTATPTPKISGTAKVGKKLTAKPGSWKPSGVKLSYQWYRSGSKIAGATKSTYKLVTKDKGKKMTVKVTGTKSGYITATKTSKATAAVKK